MSFANAPRENLYTLPQWRSWLLFGFIAAGFAALIVRALFLQWWNNDFLREQGDARYSRTIEVSANRGIISDRNGKPLAISTAVESIWAAPDDVKFSPQQLQKLASLLGYDAKELQQKLESKREFVYLKRQISPEEASAVMALGIPGISSKREFRRFYPAGETMAHLLGTTNIEDVGQEGLEMTMQQRLHGTPGERRVIKDRLGHIIEDVKAVKRPEDGQNIALSIDSNIQNLAFSQLKLAVEANKAKAGAAVVLDAKTGEVLAMATLPTFNPNSRQKISDLNVKRNRVITDTFEPGSTLKPFTAAAVLELGLFTPDTIIQTGNGTLSIGPATVRDAHPGGAMSVSQVIQKSSNVGASKMALSMKPEQMWNALHEVGFGSLPQSGFPGERAGRLRPYKSWVPIEQATMSYGHGISVTLLHLARAYGVFATDGKLMPISLLKLDAPNPGKQVFSPGVAMAVRKMLETVTQPGGTALRAQVAGYRVAGKTGTAHKPDGHGYSADKYVASFVGMAPASDPRLIIAVMIDEPSGGQYYGGTVAAPVFSNIMSGALRMLSIPPDAPSNSILMPPPDEPEVKEET